jgi:hypothetical protein
MISKRYHKKLAKGHRPDDVGTSKPVTVADNTLYLHGSAEIVIGKDKHPIRYELFTARICGLVPSSLILCGPENVLSEASRGDVILKICDAQFRAPVLLYNAPDFLAVDAYPLFRLIGRWARES